MATIEVIEGLTQVVQDCLEAKMQATFDASAALSVDIAREIGEALEAQLLTYTDDQIRTVMDSLSASEVDMTPLTDFMAEIRTLLDGDSLTAGWQIFNLLSADAATVKTGLIEQATELSVLQGNLSVFQTALSDHSARLATLEAALHAPVDCEECQDPFLGIVNSAIDVACDQSAAALAVSLPLKSESVLAAFRLEMAGTTPTGIVGSETTVTA
jgi:hypothetical protein